MKYIISCIIGILILATAKSRELYKASETKDKYCVIEGIYEDQNCNGTIEVEMWEHYFGDANQNYNKKKYSSRIHNGKFILRFPSSNKVSYIKFSLPLKALIKSVSNLFILEPSDSIFIHLFRDTVIYSGKGAGKFSCSEELRNMPNMLKYGYNLTNEERLSFDISQFDSLIEVKNRVIKKYSKDISPEIVKLMKLNIAAEYYSKFLSMIELLYMAVQNDTAYASAIIKFYRNEYKGKLLAFPEIKNSLRSYSYADYLCEKAKCDLIFKNSIDRRSKDWFNHLFEKIQTSYSKEVASEISTRIFLSSYSGIENAEFYIKKVIKNTANVEYKAILTQISNNRAEGAMVIDFDLPDSSGKIYSLKTLKGKVIILDFWFTGCGACMKLNEKMTPVYDYFKDNVNVAFVTINVDKDLCIWKQSLISGKYTHPGYINLCTKGDGSEHPLITGYSFQAFPQFLIIDKDSKLRSSMVPNLNHEGAINQFISDIKNIL